MSHIPRREFLAGVGMAVGAVIIASNTTAGQNRPIQQYTTTDIREYLLSHSSVEFVWVAEHPRTWTVQGLA